MKIPQVGVGVVVIRGEKILMGKRKSELGRGLWAFPGGHLDFGETVEACALRELEEETALKARICQLGGWSSAFFMPDKHYITLFAYVWDFEGEPQLTEPDKCEVWEWFDWRDLPKPYYPTIDSLFEKGELKSFMAQR
jgi:8-oxo-dGTP diphosphatase